MRAVSFVQRIVDSVQRLELFPESGSPLAEFPESGLKEIFVGEYRVIHRVLNRVSILRVFHGARTLNRRDLDID